MEDIYQAFLVAEDTDQLGGAIQELHEMNPPPMNTMLEKQSKEQAIKKRTERKGKTIQDVPPTNPGNFHIKMSKFLGHFNPTISKSCVRLITTHLFVLVTETVIEQQPQSSRVKARYCTACKQSMKGHKNVTNCPRNQLSA